MLNPVVCLVSISMFVGCAQGSPSNTDVAPRAAPAGQFVPGELIVQFRAGTPRPRVEEILAEQGLRIEREMTMPNMYLVRTTQGGSVLDLAGRLRSYPEVVSADPNWIRRFGPPPQPRRTPAPDG